MLTFQCSVPATIVPLHQDPCLSTFIELVSVLDLSNESESIVKYKKQTQWPDYSILFETDTDYQNKVSLEILCLGSTPLKLLYEHDVWKTSEHDNSWQWETHLSDSTLVFPWSLISTYHRFPNLHCGNEFSSLRFFYNTGLPICWLAIPQPFPYHITIYFCPN